MTTKTKPAAKTQSAEDAVKDLHKDSISSLTDLNASFIEAFSEMSAEMAKFITKRIEEDVKVQHELLHSKNLTDIQAIQMSFFEQAFKQYQEGAARMLEIGTQAFHDRSSK